MKNLITLENFSPSNRTKHIGNSLYRISRESDNKGKWYVHETYSDKNTWAGNNAFHDNSLELVIDKFNSITEEKEIVSLMA